MEHAVTIYDMESKCVKYDSTANKRIYTIATEHPCGLGLKEYAHVSSACRKRRLKGVVSGRASGVKILPNLHADGN